ncbi:hypothetical protein EVAR_67657_1 [Eumeta japonica]|uniref:Uncharacterized protein n=1 Tax=Eumeta variegata TaxID=151549 RepID=A0A4C1Z858_EUMVA|nr:hypothetical protein EVAR_67657_1 [Eumeta japonica]
MAHAPTPRLALCQSGAKILDRVFPPSVNMTTFSWEGIGRRRKYRAPRAAGSDVDLLLEPDGAGNDVDKYNSPLGGIGCIGVTVHA